MRALVLAAAAAALVARAVPAWLQLRFDDAAALACAFSASAP